jgi:hypothetical protein
MIKAILYLLYDKGYTSGFKGYFQSRG